MSQKGILLAGGVAAVAAAAAVAFVVTRGHGRPRHPHPHAATGPDPGVQRGLAPVQAMMNAPEGKTPCETAYNAIEAEQKTARDKGLPSVFRKVAPRDRFLQLCASLPEGAQRCFVPRYASMHRDECNDKRPPPGALKGMFEMIPTHDPIEQANQRALFGQASREPGADEPPQPLAPSPESLPGEPVSQ
jgi:hypothetical protein